MNGKTPEGHVPDWLLERLRHGDLTAPERTEVERRVAADPGAAARLAELDRSDQALRGQLPPLERMEQRARAGRRQSPWRWPVLVPALAMAGVALLTVVGAEDVQPSGPGPGPAEEVTRVKGGGTRLLLHRQQGSLDAPMRAGEILQLGYMAEPASHGVILSIDGRGAVTLHHPDAPTGSTALAEKGLLPSAYRLDDAPDFERFILVTATGRVDVDAVLAAARALAAEPDRARDAPLPLSGDLLQSSLVVRKATP